MEIKRYKDKCVNLEQEIQRLREQVKTLQSEKETLQRKGLEFSNIAKEKVKVAEDENASLKVSLTYERRNILFRNDFKSPKRFTKNMSVSQKLPHLT